MMRLPVHIWIREANASPTEIAGYFIVLARRLDARPQKMRLIVESTVPVSLDFDPSDGHPSVTVGDETLKFELRHRWIPEHDVPLALGPVPKTELGPVPTQKMRRTVMLIDPVDDNRFRVRIRRLPAVPDWMYALAAVLGCVAAVTLHPIFLVVAGLLFLILFVRLVPLWYNSRLKSLIK